MADNTVLPGTGETYASKDISGAKHQQVVIEGKASDYHPNQTERGYTEGQIDETYIAIDPDGLVITRTSTDEGSIYDTFPGVALGASWTSATGTGQSITVANSRCTISAGTTANAEAYIQIPIDYLPLHAGIKMSISQRIANQDIYFELVDGATPAADTMYARWHFTGTTDTLARCESQSSTDTNGNEGTATDQTIPATSGSNRYCIELVSQGVMFLYEDHTVLVENRNEYPSLYTDLYIRIRVKNGGSSPASNTDIVLDWVKCANTNRVDVGTTFHTEPLQVAINSSGSAVTGDKEHNTASPSAEAVEALSAVAKASAPTYSEGNAVMPRVTLSGDTAVTLDGEAVAVFATNLDIRDLTSVSDSITAVQATGTNLHAVIDSGSTTAVTQATASNLNATVVQGTASSLKVEPAGQVAHGATDSGNPLKIGAKAELNLSTLTPVTDGQRTDLYADSDGVPFVKLFPEADLITERVADTAGTSTAFTNFGATASTRNLIYAISIFNSSATDGYVDFRDGAAGAILFTIPAPKGGGAIMTAPFPLFKTTANTALAYDVSGAITTVYISVTGRKSKVA